MYGSPDPGVDAIGCDQLIMVNQRGVTGPHGGVMTYGYC
jgi:hypothetical protein